MARKTLTVLVAAAVTAVFAITLGLFATRLIGSEITASRAIDFKPGFETPASDRLKEALPPEFTNVQEPGISETAAAEVLSSPENLPTLNEVIFKEARPLAAENKPPRYPHAARQKGYQGEVVLDLEVNEKGCVSDIAIAHSSGHRLLDREAVRAVKDWRFMPAEMLGNPVLCRLQVPFIYRLDGESQDN